MIVGVREAARRLGINHAAVSRQVARFEGEGLLQRGPMGAFDFERFRDLRDATLNPLMARNVAIEDRPPAPAAPARVHQEDRSRLDALRQAHTAEKGYAAELKRLELLERTARTCDRASVATAGADAARALAELFDNRRRALAEALVAQGDADEIEARLAEADRATLAALRDVALRAAAEAAPVRLEDVV